MKVVVHIGMGKSGSSSLQAAMKRNVDGLLKQGVYCWTPDRKQGNFGKALTGRFLHPGKALLPKERLAFRSRGEVTAWSVDCWNVSGQNTESCGPCQLDVGLTSGSHRPEMSDQCPEVGLIHALVVLEGLRHVFLQDTVDLGDVPEDLAPVL